MSSLRRRWESVTLRWRVALAFGLVTTAVAALLSVTTWQLASGYMLDQRERGATNQAVVDARLVAENLRRTSDELPTLLVGLTGRPETSVLLRSGGRWITAGREVDVDDVPPALLAAAPARQRLEIDGLPVLAVAVPVTPDGDLFVRLAPLTELDRTLRFLSGVLVTGTVFAGLLGTLLGWWTARRALQPLSELTGAAGRMAEGDLSARLPVRREADLAPLAERFNATADALEERVRRDARFAGDVSHELRTPLTTMINAAEVLRRRRDDLPDAARRAVDLLIADVQRFHRMVEDLLEISRGIQVPEGHDLAPVDLAVVVENVPASLVPDAVVDVAEPAPLVTADRRRLDQVLANLCENAHHHAGGVVRLAVVRRDGMAAIEVDDAGPGVPVELRERVFERFTRGVRTVRDGSYTGGTGLGLALVAQHVHGIGGRVWVEDRPGGGARFVVALPEVAL
ncbi:HAMP domain-containing sensor histidine kinase [Actinomycetospora cinnamomea]|uniref:histidine kinase n=1 Tax=Actinomycetospora cinnamomea TaxID=663609 RepID=A0A2U1F3X3_9PSEU|nr:HAMP domain-containing sensor histidine kinase [Actinomycetospora cinnamomea]PVZ06885.1 signal transduction histidine kinase [Actinomycetospora cinnamomea]